MIFSYSITKLMNTWFYIKSQKTDTLNDSKVYDAEIHCNKDGNFVMSKPTLLFNSFDEYFEDFLELAD